MQPKLHQPAALLGITVVALRFLAGGRVLQVMPPPSLGPWAGQALRVVLYRCVCIVLQAATPGKAIQRASVRGVASAAAGDKGGGKRAACSRYNSCQGQGR